MSNDRTQSTSSDVALLQARRALALAERDRQALIATHRQADQRRALEQAQSRRDEEKRRAYIDQLEHASRDLTAALAASREDFQRGESERRDYIAKLEGENRDLASLAERLRLEEVERQAHIDALQQGKDELLRIYTTDTRELRSYVEKLERECDELRLHVAALEAKHRESPKEDG